MGNGNGRRPVQYTIQKHKWSNTCVFKNCKKLRVACPVCKEKLGKVVFGHLVKHLGWKSTKTHRQVVYSICHTHFCDNIDEGRNINCAIKRVMVPKKGNITMSERLIDNNRNFPSWLDEYLVGEDD